MNTSLSSKTAQNIQELLLKKGINCKVVEFSASTRTAQDAANAIECTVGQIAKSLVFKTILTGKPILVIASGPNRVDEKKIERYVGEGITKADAEFVRNVTGFAIGGIPPFGHTKPLQTFIDQDLLSFEEIWAAAGTPNAVFNLKSNDLQMLTNGKIVAIH